MRHYITFLIIAFCVSFANTQDLNVEIKTDDETPFLLGKIDKSGLTSETYNTWFTENYENYKVDEQTIRELKTQLKDYQITLFMGTWCGDSKREVPRFYKILEACNFPENQLTVIALSRKSNMYKQSPNHFEAGLNIHRVPTFIFYKNKKEVNRIVEHPVESLEKDMLNIVTKNNYKSNYQIVAEVDSILKNDGLNGLKKRRRKLIKSYNGIVSSMSELNTYARTLYSTNRFKEAVEVCKINAQLFSENVRTYESLSIVLDANGQTNEAIRILEKAIKKLPENEDLKDNLKELKST